MVDVKISELAAAGGVSDDMLLEAALTGLTNNKITVAQLSDKIINTDLGITTTLANAIQTTNATTDGLAESTTTLTSPGADQFQMTNGTTDFVVSADCTIDQNLNTSSDPSFNTVNVDDHYKIDNNRVLEVDASEREQLFVGYRAGLNTEIDGNAYRNTAVGNRALEANVEGDYNTSIGYGSLLSHNVTGNAGDNTAVGAETLRNATTGVRNATLGAYTGSNQTGGDENVYVGTYAGNGSGAHSKNRNVMVGFAAGETNEADGNIFLGYEAGYNETGSDKLYIENSRSSSPLIYGEFDNRQLKVNGGFTGNGDFYLKRTESISDYNPSSLTTDDMICMTDTSVARLVTISTEDVQSGSSSNPRIIIVKDEDGNAATNNITVSLETGTIDGAPSYFIDSDYGAIVLYLDGTNGFVYSNRLVNAIGGISEANIYYTRSNGNDTTGTGLNIEDAFLTLQKSIDTAELQLPTISNQFTVKVSDSGTYIQNIIISKPYIHLDAKNIRISNSDIFSPIFDISYTDSGYTYIDFAELDGSTGVIEACRVNTPNGTVHLKIKNNNIFQTPPIKIQAGTVYLNMDNCQSSSINFIELGSGAVLYANLLNSNGGISLAANAKAFIKINSNFTGFVTAGANAELTLICATRELLYLDAIDPTAKVRIIEIDKQAEPEQNILYVDPNGDDNRSGKRLKDSLFTWSKAITEAEIDASLANQYSLKSDAANTYSEDITISKPYVHVYSPNVIFNTTISSKVTVSHALSGYTFLTYGKIRGGGGASNPAFLIDVPSGSVYLHAKELENNISPIINLEAGNVYVQTDYINNTGAASLALVASGATFYCNALKATGDINVSGTVIYRLGSLDGNIIVSENGKANVFIGGTFSGVVVVQANAELTLSCHERTTIGFDAIDSTSTTRIIEISQEAKPEENIYYVESFGNDDRPGKRIEEAFASWNKGFTEIATESPTYLNQFTLKASSSGNYEEQISTTDFYTNIDAPNTVLRSNAATGNTLNLNGGDNRVALKEIRANSSDNALYVSIDPTFNAYLHTNYISNTGSGDSLTAVNGYSLGHVDSVGKIHVAPNGKINLVINKQDGDILLDDGSTGSLIIGNKTGTITKGVNSSVNILDLTNGLGVPFMTETQRLALSANPGTFVYDTTNDRMYYWNGSTWLRLDDAEIVKKPVINVDDVNSPYTAVLNENNAYFLGKGATTNVVRLPEANADALGITYNFSNLTSSTFLVQVVSLGEFIYYGDNTTGTNFSSNTIGDVARITCIDIDKWYIDNIIGTWGLV